MNEQEMEKVLEEIKELLKKKNRTYGDGNISKVGMQGVLVRIEEKIERLKHMIQNNIKDEEAIEDTWKDIVGYGVIGTMLERNVWGKIDG